MEHAHVTLDEAIIQYIIGGALITAALLFYATIGTLLDKGAMQRIKKAMKPTNEITKRDLIMRK